MTQEAPHTPGLFDGWSIGTGNRVYNKRGDLMATAGYRRIDAEGEAIARLICAAPALLTMLEAMVALHDWTHKGPTVQQANAVIAKAKGK